ncbi:hypothetical protein Hypma_011906 [Hypsizygus marmoreus]|uniref:F-box domain-containing protein n=1 Tax=Hypsizygus marmoreus TaxID=39966 RepID=A0A369JNA0_HYPMA|nr:hypothetical protein Hypma_011906 [Hypsizygus marmoreus]
MTDNDIIPFSGELDTDVAEAIAFHMDFLDLVKFSHTCRNNQAAVQNVLSERIVQIITRTLHYHARGFCDLLFENGVVVVGSSVTWILNANPTWTPHDLNLVAPAGKAGVIAEFLVQQGFEQKESKEMGWRLSRNGLQLWEFEGPLCPGTTGIHDYCGNVTIMESRSASVWPCILDSEATSHKDVISSHYIVSLTPKLSCHNTIYVVDHDDKMHYANKGINVIGWPSSNMRCDLWCPSECRYLKGGMGVGLLQWRARHTGPHDVTDDMVDTEYPEQPGSFFASEDLEDDGPYCMYAECYNPICPRRWRQRSWSEAGWE